MRMLKRSGGPRAIALATRPALLLRGPLLRTLAMLEFHSLLMLLLPQLPPQRVRNHLHSRKWRSRSAMTAMRCSTIWSYHFVFALTSVDELHASTSASLYPG